MTAATTGGRAMARSYGAAAPAWAHGPDRVLYDRLATVLVAHLQRRCPGGLAGARVLDVGAGTGAATRAALARGGQVVACDHAVEMLEQPWGGAGRRVGVAADAIRLPFADASFDAVVAAFVLNHLPRPAAALVEAGRVTRAGGCVAASTFEAGWDHPVKHVVDEAAARLGYRPPRWYRELKATHAPRAGDPAALGHAAERAGLRDVRVTRRTVEVDGVGPADLVAWRLGMGHLAPFVASLHAADRQRLADEAVSRLTSAWCELRPRILLLSGRVPTGGRA